MCMCVKHNLVKQGFDKEAERSLRVKCYSNIV